MEVEVEIEVVVTPFGMQNITGAHGWARKKNI